MADAATGDMKTYLVGGQAYDAFKGLHGDYYFRQNAVLRFLVDNKRPHGDMEGLRIDLNEVSAACDGGLIPFRDWVEFTMNLGYRPNGIYDLVQNMRWEVAELGDDERPKPVWNTSDGVDPEWVEVDGIPLLTLDDHGVRRFVPNAVVRYLVLRRDAGRVDLERLADAFARRSFPDTDYAWFHAMLGFPVETVRTMPAFAGVTFRKPDADGPAEETGPYRARAVDADLDGYVDLYGLTARDPELRKAYMMAVNNRLLTWDAPRYGTALPYMMLRFGPPNVPGDVGVAPFGRWLVSTPDPDVVLLVTPGARDFEGAFRPYGRRKAGGDGIGPGDLFTAFGDALVDLSQTGVRIDPHVVLFLYGERVRGSVVPEEVVSVNRAVVSSVPAAVAGTPDHGRLWDVASTIGSGNAAEGLRVILGMVDLDART